MEDNFLWVNAYNWDQGFKPRDQSGPSYERIKELFLKAKKSDKELSKFFDNDDIENNERPNELYSVRAVIGEVEETYDFESPILREFKQPLPIAHIYPSVRASYIGQTKKKVSNDFVLIIKGQKLLIPVSQKLIKESIEESLYLLDLKRNWDDEDSPGADEVAYFKCINFLANYSTAASEQNAILDRTSIELLRDGSISALWETPKAKMLIIFKGNDKKIAFLYGETKEDFIPFKYGIHTDSKIDIIALEWIKKNLQK